MSARVASDHQILQAIDQSWATHWTSPTVRELAAMVGLHSSATMAVRLEQLVRAGLLERHGVSASRVLYRRPLCGRSFANACVVVDPSGHDCVCGVAHRDATHTIDLGTRPGVWLSRAEAYALLEGHDGTSLRAAREKLRETLR